MSPPRGSFPFRGRGGGRGGGRSRGSPFNPHQRVGYQPQPRGGYQPQPRFQEAIPGIIIHENITLKEVKEGNLNERLVKIIEYLSSSIVGKMKDENGSISLHINARFEEKTEEQLKKEQQAKEKDNADEVLPGLQDALTIHLEKMRKLAEELPKKLKVLRESRGKVDDPAVENTEEEEESGTQEEDTSDESDEEQGEQQNAVETPSKPAESVKNGCLKKKRSKSENLDESLVGAKKQKSNLTPQTVVVSSSTETTKKLNVSQNSSIPTPTIKKKKSKKDQNSFVVMPSNEKTSNANIGATDTSINSSKKKKRRSQQLQESKDYLPLSV